MKHFPIISGNRSWSSCDLILNSLTNALVTCGREGSCDVATDGGTTGKGCGCELLRVLRPLCQAPGANLRMIAVREGETLPLLFYCCLILTFFLGGGSCHPDRRFPFSPLGHHLACFLSRKGVQHSQSSSMFQAVVVTVYDRVLLCVSHYHTPLVRFSKLDCSTTKRVPIPNDAYVFGKLSARCFQRRAFWHQHHSDCCGDTEYRPWKIRPRGGWCYIHRRMRHCYGLYVRNRDVRGKTTNTHDDRGINHREQ